jgi:hypothetical protein
MTPAQQAPDPADEPIRVVAAWGHMLIADTEAIIADGHGISCGARGLAVIAAGLGRTPTVQEVVEMTGDHPGAVEIWLQELAGTEYLYWED